MVKLFTAAEKKAYEDKEFTKTKDRTGKPLPKPVIETRRYWSNDVKDKIRRLAQEGNTHAAIASELGVETMTVSRIVTPQNRSKNSDSALTIANNRIAELEAEVDSLKSLVKDLEDQIADMPTPRESRLLAQIELMKEGYTAPS